MGTGAAGAATRRKAVKLPQREKDGQPHRCDAQPPIRKARVRECPPRRAQRVTNLLKRPVYAGYVEARIGA
jgi:hypothetical protein